MLGLPLKRPQRWERVEKEVARPAVLNCCTGSQFDLGPTHGVHQGRPQWLPLRKVPPLTHHFKIPSWDLDLPFTSVQMFPDVCTCIQRDPATTPAGSRAWARLPLEHSRATLGSLNQPCTFHRPYGIFLLLPVAQTGLRKRNFIFIYIFFKSRCFKTHFCDYFADKDQLFVSSSKSQWLWELMICQTDQQLILFPPILWHLLDHTIKWKAVAAIFRGFFSWVSVFLYSKKTGTANAV